MPLSTRLLTECVQTLEDPEGLLVFSAFAYSGVDGEVDRISQRFFLYLQRGGEKEAESLVNLQKSCNTPAEFSILRAARVRE